MCRVVQCGAKIERGHAGRRAPNGCPLSRGYDVLFQGEIGREGRLGEPSCGVAQPSVEELVQSCVDALRPRAEAKGVILGIDVAGALPELELDPTRIAQAVGNLLDNAVTHTPEGGRVTVSAEASDNAVEVRVADTGPGIAPNDLPRVFDRFYRADPSRSRGTGGTGLGLTIARRLVEAHGGSIKTESVVGQGSRFIIRLPSGRR